MGFRGDRRGASPPPLTLRGFSGSAVADLPYPLRGAVEGLGLSVDRFGGDLTLVDAREGLADDALRGLAERHGIAVAFGDAPTNDPAFDCAFDDALSPGLDEGETRRRLMLALRLATLQRDRAREADDRSEAMRMANANLQFALRRFEALFQGLPVACFTLDLEGTVHEWNREATAVFGLDPHEAVYGTAEGLFGAEWSPESVAQRLAGGGAFDWTYRLRAGRTVHLACRLMPVTSDAGERTAIVASHLDVTERIRAGRELAITAKRLERQGRKLERLNAELEALAVTDGLTGLGNRRRFDETLDHAAERARRTGRPFALLLLDIDRFKSVNDTFGHAAGDEVLREFARMLRKASRRHEPPMRFGGEEFAVVLEGCEEAQALVAVERIRRTVATWPWPHRAVTASIGVAISGTDERGEATVSRADAALYESKRGGRDRATLAPARVLRKAA